jgi:hypothetical protein
VRPRRSALAVGTAAGAALVAPAAAFAYATPGIDYRFPLPIWLYAFAGGVAVLASRQLRSGLGGATATG